MQTNTLAAIVIDSLGWFGICVGLCTYQLISMCAWTLMCVRVHVCVWRTWHHCKEWELTEYVMACCGLIQWDAAPHTVISLRLCTYCHAHLWTVDYWLAISIASTEHLPKKSIAVGYWSISCTLSPWLPVWFPDEISGGGRKVSSLSLHYFPLSFLGGEIPSLPSVFLNLSTIHFFATYIWLCWWGCSFRY